jgi:hypothetical protein
MSEPIDQEIEAIKAVLSALEPLAPLVRQSVLEYVLKRLDIRLAGEPRVDAGGAGGSPPPRPPPRDIPAKGTHIKELKEKKVPRSANEMAALVAYYLANLADEKKATVTTKDMETYFKIAGFPLPEQIRVTLPNAKTAGYFDAAGNGEYRLNAVGHNLVVHSMPRGSGAESVRKKGRARKVSR